MKITGRKLLAPLVAAVALTAAILPGAASATFPGGNGPIVFTSTRDGNSEIYRMNADGSVPRRLTNNAAVDTDAAWSADRSSIAFVSTRDGNSEIYTMGPNGENQTRITNDPGADTDPAFTPDGSAIVFSSNRDGDQEIFSITVDGQTTTQLTNNAVGDFSADVSTTGQIVFQRLTGGVGTGTGDEIFTMNADGTGQVNLTSNCLPLQGGVCISDKDPSWSPSGTEIVFSSNRDGDYEIFRMTSAGVSPTQLTNSSTADIEPVFSPDGNLIAFTSARTGNNEVFTITRTGASPTNRTNNAASDSEPSWTTLLDTTITSGPASGQTVTSRTPTFTFTSNEAGATFECKIDAGAFTACASPFTTPTLADGTHTFQVRSRNAFGDVDGTPASRTFSVDATNPNTTITGGPADGATINTPNAVFTFTSDESGTFECSIDLATFTVCTSPFDTGPLPDGPHTFAVRAVDAFGNTDATPATRSFTVDTGNPETTITAGPADGGLTNDSTPTFSFTSDDAPSTFECSVDAAVFTACSSPFTTDPLADGSHTFAVRAIDDGGNVDPTPASRTFTVDTTPSDTTIFAGPADGSTISEDTATFGFASSDMNDTLECSIDGAAFTPCSSFYVTPRLSDGSHTFQVRSVDAAGNPDPTPASRTFTVDAPPRTTITTGPADGSRTNDSTPTFEFTSSENDSTFECSVDGAAFAPCTTPFTTPPLADGQHTVVVRAVAPLPDGRPDAHPASRTFTVDTVAPNTTIDSGPSEGATIASATATFTFSSSEPGSTFQCSVDGGAAGTCTSPFTTGFLGDGPHSFSVTATDIAGNTDASPATRNFNVDVSPPDTTITTGPADGSSTNDNTPTFTFSADDATATFTCSVDGGSFTPCTSPFTTPALADGSHTFAVAAVDPFGNTDQTAATRTFTVDTVTPDTTILTGPSGRTSDASPSFTFSSSQPGSTFECSVDGATFGACTSPFTSGVLTDGAHTFAVRSIDPAGNVDPSPASRSFTVDTAAPETTITGGPAEGSTAPEGSVTFTFSSDDPNATFECSLDGGAFAACTSPNVLTLADGPHTFSVQATDVAGNTDPTPATRSFSVDQPPNTTIDTGPANGALITTDSPTFTFSSNEVGSTFECSIDGAPFAACASPDQIGPLSQGVHTFSVRAVDGANRPDATPATRTFTVDTIAPETNITAGPADASTINTASPSFTFGSPDATATFACSLDGASFGPCTSPQQLNGLAEGSHTFSVQATDVAGNTDPSPATRTFIVDTVSPETTIDTGPANGSTVNDRINQFTFSSSEPGSTFECSVDAAAFAACTSPFTTASLPDGSHTFAVRATDPVGNTDQTPASVTFTVNPLPETTIDTGPADGSTVTTATPTFTFSSNENTATFECSIDAAPFSACTSPFTPTLADGSHTIQVRAIDSGSQADPSPASRTFLVDATAPDTTIQTGPANGSTQASRTASFTYTSDDAGATFECAADGATFTACPAGGTTLSDLVDGAHTFSVRAVDAAGNRDGTPGTRNFTVDGEPGTTIATGPADGSTITTASPTFVFTSEDGASTFECSVDNATFTACTSPKQLGPLGEGAHTFAVRAVDAASQADSTPASRTFTVDTIVPQTTIDSGPANGSTITTNAASFSFSSDDGSAAFSCSIDGGTFGSCTSPVTLSTLSDGPHTFAVRASDAAGNADATPASRAFTVDTTPAQTTIDSGPNGATADPKPTFTFSSEAGATFQCAIDSGAFGVCTSPFTAATLSGGAHTFRVRATDTNGLQDPTPATRAFTVDVSKPETTIDSGPGEGSAITANSATFAFSSSEAGSTFECSLDGAAFAICTSPLTTGTLSVGAHNLSVRATDSVGNTDATPATRRFSVSQSTPPPNPVAPVITKKTGTIKLSSSRKAILATIRCPDGACTVTAPTSVKVKIGQQKLSVKLRVPKLIASKGSAKVILQVSRSFQKVLAAQDRRTFHIPPVKINVTSSNGLSASRTGGWNVKTNQTK